MDKRFKKLKSKGIYKNKKTKETIQERKRVRLVEICRISAD